MHVLPSSEALGKFFDRIVASARIAVTIFVASSALLLGSKYMPDVTPVVETYKSWLWVSWLISGVYSATFPIHWIARSARNSVARYLKTRSCIGRLVELTPDEKHILQEHIDTAKQVVAWSVNRIEINSLMRNGLIAPIQQRGSIGYFRVPDSVWAYLRKHPSLVETPGHPRPKRSKDEWMI